MFKIERRFSSIDILLSIQSIFQPGTLLGLGHCHVPQVQKVGTSTRYTQKLSYTKIFDLFYEKDSDSAG